MALFRLILLGVALALGTRLAGWWTVPIIALAYGLVSRSSRRPGLTAAVAGAAAWGGYLLFVASRGAGVGAFGRSLAESMQLPAWAPLTATLLFPALLAGLSSYVGARVGSRYLSRP